MDVSGLLGALVGGALGARSRPHARTARFLTGGGGRRSWLSGSNLLTAAALGWGAWEVWRTRPGAQAGRAVLGAPAGGPRSSSTVVDAQEAVPALPQPFDALRRTVALLVAAARADGELGAAEREHLLTAARAHGAEALVATELELPRTLEQIAAGIDEPGLAEDLYVLAFGVVRCDGELRGTERIWLARLAALLTLPPPRVAELERGAAQGIEGAA